MQSYPPAPPPGLPLPGARPPQPRSVRRAVRGIGTEVTGALLGASVWLWMADRNGKGRRWARVVSAVLFGIDTLALLVFFAAPPGPR
jgi:hypothetical protein